MNKNDTLSLQIFLHQCSRCQALESGTHCLKCISIAVFPTIADPYSINPDLLGEDAKHKTWYILGDKLLLTHLCLTPPASNYLSNCNKHFMKTTTHAIYCRA